MRELVKRTVFGAILVALIVGSILLSPYAYASLMFVVLLIGCFEMCRLHNLRSDTFQIIMVEVVVALFFVLASLVALKLIAVKYIFFELILMMLPFVMALFSKRHQFQQIAAAAYGSMLFIGLPASLMLSFYDPTAVGHFAGPALLIFVFCLVWTNDTFAYIVGSLLGKHPLFVRISPRKTIEGSVGGFVFSMILVFLFCSYSDFIPLSRGIAMTVIVCLFGTLGDLCESMLKRQAGVKDSGTLIPGHGGILDRFDSVFFAVPFVFVYLNMIK